MCPKCKRQFVFVHLRRLNQLGRINVASMQYNLTKLLNVEQMHRNLYSGRKLRDGYGLKVELAMQDDVNGVSWMFADLLAEINVPYYTAAINPIRGARPKPFPGAFWWERLSGAARFFPGRRCCVSRSTT